MGYDLFQQQQAIQGNMVSSAILHFLIVYCDGDGDGNGGGDSDSGGDGDGDGDSDSEPPLYSMNIPRTKDLYSSQKKSALHDHDWFQKLSTFLS